MENSGPVIRYRTHHELLGEKVSSLETELISSNLVQKWLEYLKPRFATSQLHSAKPDAYENTIGKLYEFGLRKGMEPLDRAVNPFLEWLKVKGNPFSQILVAGFLCMTGYSMEEQVDSVVQRRLEIVYEYVKNGDMNEVYIDPESIRKIPVNFRGRPILNPNLQTEYGSMLPSIHDIQAFLHSEAVMNNNSTKVERIIEFILSREYQSLYPDYGVLYEPENRRFYSMGWSLHLTDYFKEHPYNTAMKKSICVDHSNLLRLNMLSRSRTAKKSDWFKKSLEKLDQYCSEGLYCFPRSILRELGSGYWVSGRRMGLEENRRTRSAITAESTFRMLEIKSR